MTGIIDALYKRLLLAAHPVGSIYQSTAATSPEELFGGSWTAIEGRFLLGAGGGYAAGSVGGEATHRLTEAELPSMSGELIAHGTSDPEKSTYWYDASGVFSKSALSTKSVPASIGTQTSPSVTRIRFNVGNNMPHNNMPPYLTVYTWQRTA